MIGGRVVPLAVALLLAGSTIGAAQEGEPGERQAVERTEDGVRFDFQDADLRGVLSALAEMAGLNIVYTDLPSASVTLRTSRPVEHDEIRSLLESVAEANDLVIHDDGSIVRIGRSDGTRRDTEAEEPETPGAGAQGAPARLFVHELQHARAETISQTLRSLFGLRDMGPGAMADDFGFSLSQELRGQAQGALREMQPRPRAQGEPVQADRGPAQGGEPAGEGQRGLLEGAVEIVPDTRTNTIFVLASPRDYETVSAAIGEMDVRPLQVLIEVLIAEVRRSDNFALGTSVDVPAAGNDVGFQLEGLSAGDIALQVLGIGAVGADVVLNALASSSDVTILSRPVVLAQNNQDARILVGDQRPFVQLSRSLPTDQSVQDRVVQFRNVGTQLTILPTISRDGFVNLSVLQEVSSATSEVQFGAPVINTRETETQVLVRDGHTAVLGGLVDRQTEKSTSGIPLLRDIPVLGGLFGTTRTQNVANELFILLTPHVIRNDEDLEGFTRRVREQTDDLDGEMPDPTIFGPAEELELPHPEPVSPNPREDAGGETSDLVQPGRGG